MDAISSSDLVALFGRWRATFAEQRDFLILLDGKVGDSDLGITMAKAFTAAAEAVAGTAAGTPIGKILTTAGAAMAKAAPSTMGTLTATGFMRGGKALESASAFGTKEAAAFWRAYGNGIAERGKAKVGDKTILDVIDPIATTLESAAAADDALPTALLAATRAAEQALETTKTMVAQHGKAAAFQEKSVGLQDAGATVGVLMIRTMHDAAARRSSVAGSPAGDEGATSSKSLNTSLFRFIDFPMVGGRLALHWLFGVLFQNSVAAIFSRVEMRITTVLATRAQVPPFSDA